MVPLQYGIPWLLSDFLIKFKATILNVHRKSLKVESAYSTGLARVVEMVCCQS